MLLALVLPIIVTGPSPTCEREWIPKRVVVRSVPSARRMILHSQVVGGYYKHKGCDPDDIKRATQIRLQEDEDLRRARLEAKRRQKRNFKIIMDEYHGKRPWRPAKVIYDNQ